MKKEKIVNSTCGNCGADIEVKIAFTDHKPKLDKAIELIQYFVDRVEMGEIRSKKTYSLYKEFLQNIGKTH